jgi:hypothetical protein
MIDGIITYFKRENIKVHKATDTHLFLIVPKEYNPSDGWQQRMLELTKKMWGLGLKIKTV